MILLVISLASCARRELQDRKSGGDTLQTSVPSALQIAEESYEGEVYVAGNEPFTRVMLSIASSKSINLEGGPEIDKVLRKIQGERIRVTGTIKKGLMGDAILIKEFYRVK